MILSLVSSVASSYIALRELDRQLEIARTTLRSKVAHYEKDRFFAPDIEIAMQLLASRCLNALLPAHVLPSL